jgi:serine/threonine-protein kinase HipA
MKKLEVVFEGWGQSWVLGTLADDGRQVIFEYSAQALKRGLELSPRHLKLRAEAYGRFPSYLHHLPGFVSDALPDGWGLALMDRLFRQGGRDPDRVSPLDRLAFIGQRAMGALSFKPSEELVSETDWGLLELAGAAQAAQAAHGFTQEDVVALRVLALAGGSPHGARPKALVMYDLPSRVVSTLNNAAGEPWLVKFQAQTEHPEVCAIENVYAQMARDSGIRMGATQHFTLSAKLAAFGTQRFDRERGMRVPVHSMAGALHTNFRAPALDYETVLRATGFFTQDQTQVVEAFRLCVFNVVFNNRDDHAKNISLSMNEQLRWEFAPGYDLTYNAGPRGFHQTSVMGEALAPGRSHLVALASKLALRTADAADIINRVCSAAEGLATATAQASIRRATRQALVKAVETNLLRCGFAKP